MTRCDNRVFRKAASVLVACALLSGGLSWGKPAAPGAAAVRDSGDTTVSEAVSELLTVLHERQLLPATDSALRESMLKAILESLDCNAVLRAEPGGAAQSGGSGRAAAECTTIGRAETVGGLFRYIQVLEVADQTPFDVGKALAEIKYGHYEGIIVDLRHTAGDAAEAARKAADAFATCELPVVTLVNSETVGTAEMLVALIRQRCGALAVGQATRGYPFPRESATLSSGEVVMLPRVAGVKSDGYWEPTPIKPDLPVSQSLPREWLRRAHAEPGPDAGDGKDLCLRRAADLLTTINALEDKHF